MSTVSTANPENVQQLSTELSTLELQNHVKFHQFQAKVMDSTVYFQVTNFGKSIYLWVGDGQARMNDLAMSSATPYDKKGLPTTTKILGSTGDNLNESFAAKLTKRLKKPVYVSFNLELGTMYVTLLQDIEQRLFEEIAICPDKF